MYSNINGEGIVFIYKGEKPIEKNLIIKQDFNILDGEVKSYEEAKKISETLVKEILEKVKIGTMITIVIKQYQATYDVDKDLVDMLVHDFLDT